MQEPVLLGHHVDVAGTRRMKASSYLVLDRRFGDAAGQKIAAGHSICDAGDLDQFVGDITLHIAQVQSSRRDGLQVQVKIRVAVAGDQIIPAEFFLQGFCQRPFGLEPIESEPTGGKPQGGHIFRRLGRPVVGAEYNQGLIQAHLLIDELKQLRQGPVQPKDIVFGLQAGRPEQVPDVVSGRKTDLEVVRHALIILAQLFVFHQGLGEIERKHVANRCQGQQQVEVFGVAAQRMGKNTAQGF